MSEAESRPDERIERLEDRVVDLREAIRRSRILTAAGRAGALAGAAWLVGLMFGFVTFLPSAKGSKLAAAQIAAS